MDEFRSLSKSDNRLNDIIGAAVIIVVLTVNYARCEISI